MLRRNDVLRYSCNALARRISSARLAEHYLGHPNSKSWSRTFTRTAKRLKDSTNEPGWRRIERARQEIASHRPVSIEEFEKLANDGEATVDHAKACMWQRRQELDPLSVPQKSSTLKEQKKQEGTHILRWIMSQPTQDRQKISRDRLLSELVC